MVLVKTVHLLGMLRKACEFVREAAVNKLVKDLIIVYQHVFTLIYTDKFNRKTYFKLSPRLHVHTLYLRPYSSLGQAAIHRSSAVDILCSAKFRPLIGFADSRLRLGRRGVMRLGMSVD